MLPLSLPMQLEEGEEERTNQIEAEKKDEAITTGDYDEPMRMKEGKATVMEDELAPEEARREQHVDTKKKGNPCSNGTAIGTVHVEEPTAELVVTNQQATDGEKRRSARARKSNSLYKGFVMI